MKKLNLNFLIFAFIFFAIAARLVTAYFFADVRLDNEWGKLVHNFSLTGILGINVIVNEVTASHEFAGPGDVVLPSVFMPPLYAYFIYFLKIISNNFFDLVKIVIFTQFALSLISILIFFRILRKFENFNLSFLILILFSFFPIYVFATSQISSVILQIFLLLCYFYYILEFIINKKFINLFFLSVFAGLLILIRGEFILFYFLSLIYFFLYFSKNIRSILISIIVTSIIITPYLNRNYNFFNTIVLTKSFGYNLLKGNNPELRVEGSDTYIEDKFNQEDIKIKTNNDYEIKLDNFYKDQAIKIIKKNPVEYLLLYFKKVFTFMFIDLDSSYPGYYNLLNIVPKIILSITTLIGSIMALRKKGFFQFLSIYYFSNIFLFSFFFILPRYSLILLPIQILLSVEPIKLFTRKFLN